MMGKYFGTFSSTYMDSRRQKNLEKTFEKAYGEFADALFRFVHYRVSNRDEALDIVEDVFLRFWQSLMREDIREIRAFLFRTARNSVIDWYRKKKAVAIRDFGEEKKGTEAETYLDMFPAGTPTPDVEGEVRLLIEKIQELEPIYREAIYLRYVEELTPREISEITGEPTNLISVRVNRGKKLLKAKLRIEDDTKKKR